ncbi:MAG: hypothetical protein EOP84_09840 [Verrucomicrobiaceae bacterium]|nr:MAG: hypothetical protein EOP84_09840 [Verrucomicrobiaceae bacterium]
MNEIIPCSVNEDLKQQIERFAEVLKTEAHKLGSHGLDEQEFYHSGLFRGAIERIRGQFSATMGPKREFVRNILNHMEDRGFIQDWESAGDSNRHDYSVRLSSGKIAVIELKGCLDGNNTTIFERPPHAEEFVLWSLCTNPGADPRHNVWSGIHTRLSAEIISRSQRIDGMIVWDMVCGTIGRPCPKVAGDPSALTDVGPFRVPPPCVYVFPATIASVRNNPRPVSQTIANVEILDAFHRCFGGRDDELNFVDFEIEHRGSETTRLTRIRRGGEVVRESQFTPIRRQ